VAESTPNAGRLFDAEPVLAVCGLSGAGKTTLLVDAINRLSRCGLRVGVIKHDVHGITVDPSAKDSARLFSAGADVVLQGPGESLRRDHGDAELGTTIDHLLSDHDLVLVEGHRSTPLPKIWLSDADGRPPDEGVVSILEILPRDDKRSARFAAWLEGWLDERWSARRLIGGVLIGGNSRRMGSPKQLLTHEGRPLVEVVADALEPAVDTVVLLGGGECTEGMEELPRLPDVQETAGPLAGMLAALRWQPRAAWIFAACDLPLLRTDAVRWLVEQRRPGRWGVLPRISDTGVEPLLALYEPQTRRLLEGLARRGCLAPRHITDHPAVATPEPPSELTLQWTNANTPEDLAALATKAHG